MGSAPKAHPPRAEIPSGGKLGREEKIMVGVAQLAEHLVVVQAVAGSIPVAHPIKAPRSRSGRFVL